MSQVAQIQEALPVMSIRAVLMRLGAVLSEPCKTLVHSQAMVYTLNLWRSQPCRTATAFIIGCADVCSWSQHRWEMVQIYSWALTQHEELISANAPVSIIPLFEESDHLAVDIVSLSSYTDRVSTVKFLLLLLLF